jgi:glycosyltransferase involved in cell wall biosynthesis
VFYGGIERIVDGLINQYSKLGHDVYLIAHKDSSNMNTKKIFFWPAQSSSGIGNILSNMFELRNTFFSVKPDIIHSFSRLLYLYPLISVFNRNKIRIVQSYQRAISPKSTGLAYLLFREKIHFTACSEHLIKKIYLKKAVSVISNFTDTNFYKDDSRVEKEFLFFLGRIEEIKGTRESIEVAIATNTKLIIAGNIPSDHQSYFNKEIEPYLNNPLIEYVGPLNDVQKLFFLQRSKALLFPIKWEEPFGIVMVEAMACGTPVIGFNRGSVAEVVTCEKYGFVVDDINEMTEKVNEIELIDRKAVRLYCEKMFSSEKIANNYLELFKQLIQVD